METSSFLAEATDLRKDYGTTAALTGLNLKLAAGEVYGLLGPNGAGKTTTLKILCGLEKPTSGYVRVVGYDPAVDVVEVKRRVGYVAESSVLYESLTPREFLEFVASTRRLGELQVERGRELLKAFGLAGQLDVPIGALSMGTKQKVSLVAAFIHDPPLLLLDEPLNGLDAKSGRILKELILIHSGRGRAVVFSTHVMEVAQNICSRIGIINSGRIVAEGTMAELRRIAGSGDSSLEELFLRLTEAEDSVKEIIEGLREGVFSGPG